MVVYVKIGLQYIPGVCVMVYHDDMLYIGCG